MTSLKWIIHERRKREKRSKKIHKTIKAKQNHFYLKEKESMPATSEQQKTLQDPEYNYWTINKVVRKRKLLRNEKKEKKNMKIMIIRRKSRKKKARTKCNFRAEEFLGPQLQIILGEKFFGPQARLRITPIAHSLRANDCRSMISKLYLTIG